MSESTQSRGGGVSPVAVMWFGLWGFLGFVIVIVAIARPDYLDALLIGIGQWLRMVGWMLFAFAVLSLLLAAGLLSWSWVIKLRLARTRQQDGAWPIQEIRLRGGGKMFFDPNLAISPFNILHPQHGAIEVQPAAGWDRQLSYAQAVERTRGLQAIFKGDQAHSNRDGAMSESPKLPASAAKLLADVAAPSVVDAPPVLAHAAAPAALTFQQAFRQATADRLIVGQADDGALAEFQPKIHAHAAIIGATGTGKTTTAGYALVGQAARAGYHVVILDPESGAGSWAAWGGVAERVEVDRASFAAAVQQVYNLYESRAAVEAGDASRPVLVVVEEYGDMISQLRTVSRADAMRVDAQLDTILRRGRKRALHMLFVDQYPDNWSPQVMGGCGFRAVFRLGPNQGAKVREYDADKLPPRGVFLVNGRRFRAWNVGSVSARMLSELPPVPPALLGPVGGDGAQVPVVGDGWAAADASPVAAPAPGEVAPSDPATAAEKRALVFGWRADNPTGSQADLRAWLAVRNLNVARGYISDLFGEWDSMSAAERLAALGADGPVYVGGHRLGVDPSASVHYGGGNHGVVG